jgi:hypothetical protein
MVLVHLGKGTTFRLNHTGKRVWELVKEGRSQAEIVTELQAAWSVPAAQLNLDVATLLHQLLRERLLQPAVEESKP